MLILFTYTQKWETNSKLVIFRYQNDEQTKKRIYSIRKFDVSLHRLNFDTRTKEEKNHFPPGNLFNVKKMLVSNFSSAAI